MATLRSDLILSLKDKVTGPARGVGNTLDRLGRKTGSIFDRMGSGMSAIVPAAVAGPAAAGLAIQQATAQAADFESALTEIQKKGGLTAEQTAAVGEEIKALATSGDIAVGIDEIASAYERGAAAGLPINDLREFALQSVKAADAFGMSAEETGDFASKLQTALGMSAAEVKQVLDLTNSLADSGISNERDIVSFMDRAGATLKTLGSTKEETLALGATLLNVGMQSEVASTMVGALAGKLLTIGELSGKKKNAFEKYLGPTEDFAKLVEKDANGALLKMLDTLKGLNKTDRMSFLSNFVGTEWADEMLRLVEATDEYRRSLRLAADEASWMGSLDTSYALKLDDFWSQWQIMKNALAELAIDSGTMGMPAMKSALQGVRSLIDEIGAGLDRFELTLDAKGLSDAQAAVGNLVETIGGLMGLTGDDSAIVRFFERLATAANTVSASIGAVQDVAQSLGLAEPDKDTVRDRTNRRDQIVDGFNEFNPVVGPAVKSVYDVATGRRTIEEDQAIKRDVEARRAKLAEMSGKSVADLDAERAEYWRRKNARMGGNAVDFEQVQLPDLKYPTEPIEIPVTPKIDRAAIEAEIRQIDQRLGELQSISSQVATGPGAAATVRAAADEMERLIQRRDELDAKLAQPLAQMQAPNIATPIEAEIGRAELAAQAGGQNIKTALDITAAPTVNTASIDAALAKAQALNRELNAVAGNASRATAAVNKQAANAASVSRQMSAKASANMRGTFGDVV